MALYIKLAEVAVVQGSRIRPVGLRREQSEVVHGKKDAAVHRLQAVLHVGQSSPHNHRHRILHAQRNPSAAFIPC